MSGFTLVDFSIPARDHPMSHPPSVTPHCKECLSLDLCFFNPLCSGCQEVLSDSKTSIPELFAVMRQWAPQTQKNISSLSREVLRRGANINDKDGLTDLSLLHYACKAGAVGVGNTTSASNLVQSLISKGADTTMRCRWTDMNCMHYAVYFDAADNVRVLAEKNPSLVMSTCSELSDGTCLHLAAANLSLQAGKVLLQHGADGSLRDSDGKTPYDLIPEDVSSKLVNTRMELVELLKNAAENPPTKRAASEASTYRGKASHPHDPALLSLPSLHDTPRNSNLTLSHRPADPAIPKSPAPSNYSTISTTSTPHSTHTGSSASSSPLPEANGVTMASLGLRVGSKVIIDATSSKPKLGVIRFGGTTEFHPGQWAGIELDNEVGKNDGSYGGIRYFTCKAKHGLFVPMHRVSKNTKNPRQVEKKRKKKNRDSSINTSLAIEAQSHLRMNSEMQTGDRVVISGNRFGVLRYSGTVKFAPGFWMGVELDMPTGKNDGSMNGIRYFKCLARHGVFVLQSKVKMSSEPYHRAKRTPSSRTPVSSGAESNDYVSVSGSVSLVNSGASGASEAEMTSPSPHISPATLHKRLNGISSNNSKCSCRSGTSSLSRQSIRSGSSTVNADKASPDIVLAEGMSVFVNKEMGIVKFIGKTDFSEGIWLGVELRKPVGKNDGIVRGKRYFSCKQNCGLFIKPGKATHRGIKCSSILPKKL